MTIVNSKFRLDDKVISVKNTADTEEGFIGFIIREAKPTFDWIVGSNSGVEKAFYEHELELLGVGKESSKPDAVNHPKHYAVFEQLEAIEVIASSMTTEQFYGYCLGNILKYRLRAGGKDDVMQELGKADKYQELFTKFKCLCKDGV